MKSYWCKCIRSNCFVLLMGKLPIYLRFNCLWIVYWSQCSYYDHGYTSLTVAIRHDSASAICIPYHKVCISCIRLARWGDLKTYIAEIELGIPCVSPQTTVLMGTTAKYAGQTRWYIRMSYTWLAYCHAWVTRGTWVVYYRHFMRISYIP